MVIQRQINRIYRLIQILGKPYFIVTVIFLICSCNRKIIESNSSYIYDNVNDTSKFKKLNELKITFLNDYCYVYEMHYYGCSYHKAKYKVIFRNIILFKVESVGNNSYYSFYETYNPKNKDSIVIKSSWIDKYDTIPLSSIDLLISSDTMILLKSSSKGILLLKNDTGIKKISIKIFNEITEFQKRIPNSNDISINYFPGTDTNCNYKCSIGHKLKLKENILSVKSNKKKYFLKKSHTRN